MKIYSNTGDQRTVSTGVDVLANGALIAPKSNLNFNNTSTVNVSISPNGINQANISFAVNATAFSNGTVISVGTGLGLTGGPITTSGNISANVANTTIQGVTKLVDITTSTDSGNAATANSVNAAYTLATNAYSLANAVNGIITSNSNITFVNSTTVNVSVTPNVANVSSNIQFTVNLSSINISAGQTRVFVAGATVGNSSNLNFVSANTSNLTISGTQNSSPGNVTITLDTRLTGGGGGTPAGANQQLQFNNNGSFGASSNITYNLTSNLLSVEASVRLANGSNLYFGGSHSNTTTNSHVVMSYNVTANSVDFIFQ